MKRIFIGITGASGALYAKSFIEHIAKKREYEIHLCITPDGLVNMNIETKSDFSSSDHFLKSIGVKDNVYNYHYKDFAASVSSGSFKIDKYCIVPASMGCVGRIAAGASSNLIERCADVAMKENRQLILLFREMPLNKIHLGNLLKLADCGAIIAPAAPGFYHNPETIEDLKNFVIGKLFDILEVEHNLYKKWE